MARAETMVGLELLHYKDDSRDCFKMSRATDDPRWQEFASELDTALLQNGGQDKLRDGTVWSVKYEFDDQPVNACGDVAKICKRYEMSFRSNVYTVKQYMPSPVKVPKQVHMEPHPERFPKQPERPAEDPAASEHVILAMQRAFNDAIKELKEIRKSVELKEADLEVAKGHADGAERRLNEVICYLEKYSNDTDWRAEAQAFLQAEDEG